MTEHRKIEAEFIEWLDNCPISEWDLLDLVVGDTTHRFINYEDPPD